MGLINTILLKDRKHTVITWDQSNEALGALMEVRQSLNSPLRISLEKNDRNQIISITLKNLTVTSEVDYRGYITVDAAGNFFGITEDQYFEMFQCTSDIRTPWYGQSDGVSKEAYINMVKDSLTQDADIREDTNQLDMFPSKQKGTNVHANIGKVYLNVDPDVASDAELYESAADAITALEEETY